MIPRNELDESPQETWTEDGLRARIRYVCRWEDRNHLVSELQYQLYPRNPMSGARALAFDLTPFGGCRADPLHPSLLIYPQAIVVAHYSTAGPQTVDLISETLEPTAEFLTVDPTDLRWGAADGDALKNAEAPGRLMHGCEFVVTHHRRLSIPPEVISLTGHVNDATIQAKVLGLTFAAETLLFKPPRLEHRVTTSESQAWKITCRMSYKAGGWNNYFRPGQSTPQSIYHKDNGRFLSYPTGDFSALL